MTHITSETAELRALYERFAKRYEPDHWGEYVAITPDGQTMLDRDVDKLQQHAHERFGSDHTIFKVGEVAASKWL